MIADTSGEGRAPLDGCRVIVTRPRPLSEVADDEFVSLLRRLGARVFSLPTVRVERMEDEASLIAEASRAAGYDWIVFTSANGVERFQAALEVAVDGEWPVGPRVCAVGPMTARAVERAGGAVDSMPDEYLGDRVAEAITRGDPGAGSLAGRRVLFPRAKEVRSVLGQSLRAAGAEVVEVIAYRTVADSESASEIRRLLGAGDADVVTFTSGSAARAFARWVGADSIDRAVVASIGPATSEAARAVGIGVTIEASTYTTKGLAEAIVGHYVRGPDGSVK